MIKAVIFDMDGLMIDSERVKNRFRSEIKRDMGYGDDSDLMSETFGKTRTEIRRIYIERYGPGYPLEEIYKRCNALWKDYLDEYGVPIKKGLIELLEYLKDSDYQIGVATSTGERETKYLLKEADIIDYFDVIVTGEMVVRSKPQPDVYLKAARLLSIEPEYCMALEDSPNGVRSALNAGMEVVMVPDMIEPTGELKKIASYVVDSLDDVIPILKRECRG